MDREKIDENDLFEQFEVTQHKNLFRAFSSESWSFKEFLEEFVLVLPPVILELKILLSKPFGIQNTWHFYNFRMTLKY